MATGPPAGDVANSIQEGNNSTDSKEIDSEKKAKKNEKTAIKALKKEKALAKQKAREEAEAKPSKSTGKAKKAAAEESKAKEAAAIEALIKRAEATPEGTKKQYGSIEDMPKAYHPRFIEAAMYSWWEKSGFFKPSMTSNAETFVVVLPPPNVTGTLHLGHALTDTVQDAVVRFHRMRGKNVLWVPGLDHASIATQSIVEKTLRKRGVKREDLGREGFLAEVHAWVEEKGGRICQQMRRLGASCDWGRQAYTMSPQLSAAVRRAFLAMHADGLVYRDVRLVNWDCQLRTAVSDSEVDYEEIAPYTKIKVPGYAEPVEFGVLTSFAYKLEEAFRDPSGELRDEIVVATTRPETMVGDSGIAVHPKDPRYEAAVGKFAVHPLDGRRIPIVADDILVDMEFGTGAVKITPAHDPNDFATGKRHGLEFINILTDDGRLNSAGGRFQGLPRFQARAAVVEWLAAEGLFRGTEGNKMRLGTCSRSGDVIEPVIKPQWWVDCGQMGRAAAQAVHDGSLTVLPSPKPLLEWISRLRDWCISRQLWWGHRIPAYYYSLEGEPDAPVGGPDERTDHWVAAEGPAAAERLILAKHPGQAIRSLQQDEDVLDTWFSSGLFPFSVMGWPQQTPDFAKFYPNSLLETGNDIVFFWVLRMIMMGLQLTGKLPFHTVYLHGMVRDAHGVKMSKSLGNVIDPIDVIEGISLESLHAQLKDGVLSEAEIERATAGQKAQFPDGIEECGTDALRLTLLQYLSQGRDLNLDVKRIVASRHWCNKLWNAMRFALLNLGAEFRPAQGFPGQGLVGLPLPCRWILSRLSAAISSTISNFESYDFGDAVQNLYAFWQYELCDVFIELVKPVFQAPEPTPEEASEQLAFRNTLWLCLDVGLRLIHPVMPFVSEELWQRLPKGESPPPDSLMLAAFPPLQPSWGEPVSEADMAFFLDIARAVRALRSEYNLTRERPQLFLQCTDSEKGQSLRDAGLAVVAALGTARSAIVISADEASRKTSCAVAVVNDVITVMMELSGSLLEKEVNRLREKQTLLEAQKLALEKRRGVAGYGKSPAQLQLADTEKAEKIDAELANISVALVNLEI